MSTIKHRHCLLQPSHKPSDYYLRSPPSKCKQPPRLLTTSNGLTLFRHASFTISPHTSTVTTQSNRSSPQNSSSSTSRSVNSPSSKPPCAAPPSKPSFETLHQQHPKHRRHPTNATKPPSTTHFCTTTQPTTPPPRFIELPVSELLHKYVEITLFFASVTIVAHLLAKGHWIQELELLRRLQ